MVGSNAESSRLRRLVQQDDPSPPGLCAAANSTVRNTRVEGATHLSLRSRYTGISSPASAVSATARQILSQPVSTTPETWLRSY